MPKLSRLVLYAAVGIAALVLMLWIFNRLQPLWEQRGLQHAIRKLEPWDATTNYPAAGWSRLAAASKLLRATPSALAERVLAGCATGPDAEVNRLKCFLLLRFAFDLPENGSAAERAPSRPPEPAPGEANPDGSVNLAWPLAWNGGRPHLVSGSQGALDPGYLPQQDFTFLRYQARYRDLTTFQP